MSNGNVYGYSTVYGVRTAGNHPQQAPVSSDYRALMGPQAGSHSAYRYITLGAEGYLAAELNRIGGAA